MLQGPADRHDRGVKDLLRGDESGLCGARPKGKKVLIVVVVERREPRCRMAILRDGSANPLHPFVVAQHIEPGSTVVTDGWSGHQGIDRLGYLHEPNSQ